MRSIDKMYGAKNIAVVGHGHCWHPQFFHTMGKLFDVACTVEKGVVGMQVKVDELIAHWGTGPDIASILAAWRGCATPENGAILGGWYDAVSEIDR